MDIQPVAGDRDRFSTVHHIRGQQDIRISEEPREHQRTKHIDVRFMYMRDLFSEKKVQLKYIKSEDQIADVFTKPLLKSRFLKMCKLLGMIN